MSCEFSSAGGEVAERTDTFVAESLLDALAAEGVVAASEHHVLHVVFANRTHEELLYVNEVSVAHDYDVLTRAGLLLLLLHSLNY